MKQYIQERNTDVEAVLRLAKRELFKPLLIPVSATVVCGIVAAALARHIAF